MATAKLNFLQKNNHAGEMLRYLLGELSLEEKARFEERYLAEGDYFEQLLDVEDKLIHRYVMDELAGRERELFERHFLAMPQNREKVKRAEALKAYLTPAQPQEEPARAFAPATFKQPNRMVSWLNAVADFLTPQKTGLKLAYALAPAAMIFLATSLFLKTNEFGAQLSQFESEHRLFLQKEQEWRQQAAAERGQRDELAGQLQTEQNRRVELERELTQQRRPVPQRDIFTMALQPGISRSEQDTNLFARIAASMRKAKWLEIQLLLNDPQDYESYRVFLMTAGEDTVLIRYGLQAHRMGKGKVIVLQLPTSVLSDDDYQISVKGVTAARDLVYIGSYPLLIAPK